MTQLEKLQKEYNDLVKLARDCDYNLTPDFERELIRLTRVIKSLGGRV